MHIKQVRFENKVAATFPKSQGDISQKPNIFFFHMTRSVLGRFTLPCSNKLVDKIGEYYANKLTKQNTKNPPQVCYGMLAAPLVAVILSLLASGHLFHSSGHLIIMQSWAGCRSTLKTIVRVIQAAAIYQEIVHNSALTIVFECMLTSFFLFYSILNTITSLVIPENFLFSLVRGK